MSGNPPACNALHVPSIEGEIDCADWKLSEAIAGGLTPDGLHLRERLDQGQVPIAEIIQRRRSEQVERWREAFERGDPFGDLPEITHDPRGNLRIRDGERFRAATRPTQQPSITLSQLQEAMRGCPRPRGLRDVWRIALPGDPMPYYSININSDFPATEASFELVTVTPIETPDGLKWSFQGTVILD